MALQGVNLQTTPPRSPESNGVFERFNKTIQDKIRTVMIAAAIPSSLWAEVLQASNMSCPPFEKWSGVKPDVSKLRVIGCKAFCKIDRKQRGGKFNPLGYMGVLVNYCASSLAYKIWNFERNKVYDVTGPVFA